MPKAIFGRWNIVRGGEEVRDIGQSARRYALICPEDKEGSLFTLWPARRFRLFHGAHSQLGLQGAPPLEYRPLFTGFFSYITLS